MLNLLISLIGIVITILLVVGVHELGHFLVAKFLGIKVLRFSIGFGKALYSWHDKKGTEYLLSAIPLGGYVKMLDEHDEHVRPIERNFAFNRQPFYKKMAVIAAGPIANLIFAFLIYWCLFVVGFITIAPVIGDVIPHSIAEKAGLMPQQEILKVDGIKTSNWTTVIVHMIARSGDKTNMKIDAKDLESAHTHYIDLDLSQWHLDELKPDPLESLGIIPYEPLVPAIVGSIQPDSPAIASNLLIGDKILSIDGKPTPDWFALSKEIANHTNPVMQFTILRQNKTIELSVTPSFKRNLLGKKHAYLGISPAFEWPEKFLRKNQYGPLEAISYAVQDVKSFVQLNFIILGKMLTGKISLKSLGGPITIFQGAGTALHQGYIAFFSFLAFLSISIGIMNILPIPGLDGGHLLFQTIETLFRKPISERTQTLCYRLGLIFIFLIMIQALTNDIMRLF
jgi:regulator of sigma E protease